ncbi:hypothetical protein KBB05_00195 [Patescibacteria group bacterium]|nr:hypothetical protein [Patescibacteria group bacterium]
MVDIWTMGLIYQIQIEGADQNNIHTSSDSSDNTTSDDGERDDE